MSTPIDGLPGEPVRGHETEAAVRAVAVAVPQPVAHGDADVVVVVEPPPIGELPAEAEVVALDDPVLPGAARVDGDGPTKGSGRYSTTLTLKLPKSFAFSISHS